MNDSYHHGSLREAALARAALVITEQGVEALTLRGIARDLGVSHTAPIHHFGSKEGLLTALAAEGFTELASRLAAHRQSGAAFVESAVVYVDFALERPAHFDVMFTPSALVANDTALDAARQAAFDELRAGAEVKGGQADPDAAGAIIAAWSMAHGLAVLAKTGNLDSSQLRAALRDSDIHDITRRSASMLFGSGGPSSWAPE